MAKPEAERILREAAGGNCFPSPSPVLIRLVNLASDERSSHAELASIIEQDPGLTARVIRMANSVAFSVRERNVVSTVSQAILRIGFDRLRILALSLSLRDSFPMGRVGRIDYEFFWKSSLFRAHAAQGLFEPLSAKGDISGEEVFTAGLVLEIGLLVLFHLCPQALQSSFPGEKASLEEIVSWEEDNLGINHRRIGEILLKRWQFPEPMIELQRRFGPEAVQDRDASMGVVVELARTATETFFGKNDSGDVGKLMRLSGLTEDRISEILLSSFAKVEKTAGYLCINLESDKELLDATERANHALERFLFGKPAGTSPRA